jgi:O-antigen/teichoic acid export membrane protein
MIRKGLIFHTLGLIANNFSSRLINGFDTLMLSTYLPMSTLGRYRLVSHCSNALIVVQHFVFLTLPWQLRKPSIESEHSKKSVRLIQAKQLMLLFSTLPVFLGIVVFSKPLLSLLGESYISMAIPLVIFIVIRYCELLWGPQHEVLISNGKSFFDTGANVCAIVFALFIFFIARCFLDTITSAILMAGLSSFVGQLVRYIIIKRQKLDVHLGNFQSLPWAAMVLSGVSLCYVVIRGA